MFSNYLLVHLNDAFIIETFLTDIRAALSDLAEGKLSPWLITPKILHQTIFQIQRLLNADNLGYKILTNQPQYYYKFGQFTMYRNDSKLYVSLSFPLATYADSFTTFKVMSFPIPINNSLNHASQLLDLPDYFLISKDKKFYTTLTHKSMTDCQHADPMHCFIKPNLYSTTNSTACVLHLFQGNKQLIKKYCNFRFLTYVLQPNIIQLTNTDLLIYQTKTIMMQCNSTFTQLQGCDFCIITIPCHCKIQTSTNTFLPNLADCNSLQSQNITTLHPVNLALLQHFFSEDTLSKIIPNSTFPNPIDIKIPSFKIYQHNMKNILADDKSVDLNLKKIIQRVKKDNVVYSDLTETLLDGEIS